MTGPSDPYPIPEERWPIKLGASKPCSYKSHLDYYRGREDGTINCEMCHPSGERLRLMMEAEKGRVVPRYYMTLEPSPAAKKRRDKLNSKVRWGDDED